MRIIEAELKEAANSMEQFLCMFLLPEWNGVEAAVAELCRGGYRRLSIFAPG